MGLKFVTSRELSKQPGRVLKGLKASKRPQVVTQNGVPAAFLVPVSSLGIEADLETLRRIFFGQAISALQKHAAMTGVNDLSEEDISTEISAVRAGQRRRKK